MTHHKYIYLLMVSNKHFCEKYFHITYSFNSDPRHPIAEQLVPIVSGVQDQEVIIPCKPTSKMVSVQLIKEGDEVIYNPK